MIKKIFYLLAILALGMYACSTNHGHEDAHAEAHEHESISITKHEGNYELFMEFSPLIAGNSSEFLIHLTKLDDYTPVTGEEVILEISGFEKTHSEIIAKPLRPGIYITEFVPPAAGHHLSIRIFFSGETIDELFEISGIEAFASEKEFHEHSHEHEEHTAEGDIQFLLEQAWETDFGVTETKRMPFSDILKVSGEIQALPTSGSNIVANATGIVEFSRETLLPGQRVSTDEALFYIKPGNLAGSNIRTQYLHSRAEFEKAAADYERAQKLVKDQIISQKEFAEVKAEFERAKAEFESVSGSFGNNGQLIASPINGVILKIRKTNGSYVEQGDILAEIISTDHLMLKADIPQHTVHNLAELKSANFKSAGSEKVYNTDSLDGTLLSVAEFTVTENYYLPVYFKIRNPGTLIPGTYAEIYLKFSSGENALLIPRSAIMESEGNYYVYVQESAESYKRQDVGIGGSDGQMVSITGGLETGQWVVSRGAYRVKLASMSGELPSHGHAH